MSDIRWAGLSHEEIYTRVQQGPGPSASDGAEAAWSTVENTIRSVDEQLTHAVRQIGVEWQGAAADSTRGGMTVMSNWALDAAGDALLTKNGITEQARSAGRARAAVPAPLTAEWNEAVAQSLSGTGFIPGVTDFGALEDRMAEERAKAVDAMNRYNLESSANQQMMNYWTQPPAVVVETVAPAAAGASSGAGIGAAVGSLTPAAFGAQAGVAVAGDSAAGTATDLGIAAGSGVAANGGTAGGAGELRTGATPAPLNPNAGLATAAARRGAQVGAATPGDPLQRGVLPNGPSARPGVTGRPGAGSGSARAGGGTGAGLGTSPRTERFPRVDLPAGGVRPVVPGLPPGTGTGSGPALGDREGITGPHGGATRGSPAVPGALPGGLGGGSATELGPRSGFGGSTEPVPRAGIGGPSEGAGPGRVAAEAAGLAERPSSAARGSPASGHGLLPLGGVAGRPVSQDHRRADYLIDDTDAFADDRWFTPAVIVGDEEPEGIGV